MKQIITAKLKLNANKDQAEALKNIGIAFRDSLNLVSKIAFTNNKTSNSNILQKLTYKDIRKSGLPSTMACGVCKQVAGSYKTLWTITKKNAKALKEGKTKRRYKGLDNPPVYHSRTSLLFYGRDYSFKKDQMVSVATLNGRILIPYSGYNKHLEYIKNGSKIQAARLHYDRRTKTYYLLVSLELEIPDLIVSAQTNVIGIDVGQRYLAVVTDMNDNTLFIPGKEVVKKGDKYKKKMEELNNKKKDKKQNRLGTHSVTRRLIMLSGRERRHKMSINHQISSKIIKRFPNSIVGMENLTDIRDRIERRSSKKSSAKQKKANRRKSTWAFAESQDMIKYKAVMNGSIPVKVDAHYTSQSCVKCGHTGKENRPNSGLDFICVNCGFKLHSDLIGARNIAMRTLLARQDFADMGRLSTVPYASNDEAKTERFKTYSGLRWSSEVSSCL